MDSPRTDAGGKVRVPIGPGKHRLGVGNESLPPFQQVVEFRGQEVECRAGETAALRFEVRDARK